MCFFLNRKKTHTHTRYCVYIFSPTDVRLMYSRRRCARLTGRDATPGAKCRSPWFVPTVIASELDPPPPVRPSPAVSYPVDRPQHPACSPNWFFSRRRRRPSTVCSTRTAVTHAYTYCGNVLNDSKTSRTFNTIAVSDRVLNNNRVTTERATTISRRDPRQWPAANAAKSPKTAGAMPWCKKVSSFVSPEPSSTFLRAKIAGLPKSLASGGLKSPSCGTARLRRPERPRDGYARTEFGTGKEPAIKNSVSTRFSYGIRGMANGTCGF